LHQPIIPLVVAAGLGARSADRMRGDLCLERCAAVRSSSVAAEAPVQPPPHVASVCVAGSIQLKDAGVLLYDTQFGTR